MIIEPQPYLQPEYAGLGAWSFKTLFSSAGGAIKPVGKAVGAAQPAGLFASLFGKKPANITSVSSSWGMGGKGQPMPSALVTYATGYTPTGGDRAAKLEAERALIREAAAAGYPASEQGAKAWVNAGRPGRCNCPASGPLFSMPAQPATQATNAMARVMADKVASLNGLGSFGENEDYCNKTYPPGITAEITTWNTKCKKGGTITNPAAFSPPWTTVGKNARGLPGGDISSIVNSAIAAGKKILPGQPGAAGTIPTYTGGASFMDSPYFMPVALAAVAGVVIWKMKK